MTTDPRVFVPSAAVLRSWLSSVLALTCWTSVMWQLSEPSMTTPRSADAVDFIDDTVAGKPEAAQLHQQLIPGREPGQVDVLVPRCPPPLNPASWLHAGARWPESRQAPLFRSGDPVIEDPVH